MSVGAISAGSLAQDVLTSSNITQAQQAWQKVQTSLAAGDLTGAKSAFATFQQINQNLSALSATTTGTQLSTDLSTLGSALTAGNLSSAQTAFATVQNDLKNSQRPAGRVTGSPVGGWLPQFTRAEQFFQRFRRHECRAPERLRYRKRIERVRLRTVAVVQRS